jgi:hypothetical protein
MIVNSISGLVFASNAILLWLNNQPLYATLMCLLTITSVWNHYVETKISAIIDKIAVYAVVLYGGYHFLCKNVDTNIALTIITMFIASGLIYYVILPQISNPLRYVQIHGLLHFVASIGHHLIALS